MHQLLTVVSLQSWIGGGVVFKMRNGGLLILCTSPDLNFR